MVNRPKAIGTAGETAVVRYLNANGFPSAERPALHGALDEGDVTGTPGLCWEVKAGHAAETASDAQVALWLAEAEVERLNRGADISVLVRKRPGKGPASAGQWWAHLPGWAFVELAVDWLSYRSHYLEVPPVQLTLAEAVHLLRRAGFGDAVDLEATA